MFKYFIFSFLITPISYGVTLPTEAALSLKTWNAQFKIFNETDYSPAINKLFEKDEAPMMFKADLNNDKLDDFVVIGQDNKKQYVVALIKEKKSWIPIEVSSQEKEKVISTYISVAEEGLAEKIKPKRAIQVERYLGQPEIFEIKDHKAVKLTL